jgi:hypothetical protein
MDYMEMKTDEDQLGASDELEWAMLHVESGQSLMTLMKDKSKSMLYTKN